MPIRVKLPNGKIAQFPDGTSPEEIDAALRGLDQRTLVTDASIPRRAADFGVKAASTGVDIAGGVVDVAQPDAAAPFSQVTRPLELMAQRAVKAVPAIQALPGIGPIATGLATAGRGREMAMALDSAAMGLVGDQETRAAVGQQRIAERVAENQRREAEGRQSLEEETAAQPATRASQAMFAASDTAYDKLVSDRTKAGDIEMGRAYDKGLLDWLSAAASNPGDAVLQLGPSVAAFIAAGGVTGAMARGAGASRAASLTAVTQSQGAMASDLSARAQQERVSGMTPEEFAQTPTGRALIESGLTPEEAQQQTALLAYDTTLAASLPLNAVAMSLTTRLGGNPVEEALAGARNLNRSALTKPGLTGRLQRGAQAGVREGLGESVQGATEQLAGNIGGIGAGIQGRETLFDDVLKAGVIEGIAGAPTGAAFGLMQRPMTEQQVKDLRTVEAARVARERLSTPTEKDNPLAQGMRDAQAVVEAARAGKFAQPMPTVAPAEAATQEGADVAPAPQSMEPAPIQTPAAATLQQPVTQAAPIQVPRGTVEPATGENTDIDALLDMTERQRGVSLDPSISPTSDPAALAAYTARTSAAGAPQAAAPPAPPPVEAVTTPPVPPAPVQSRMPGAAPSMATPRDETRGGIDGLIEPVADYGQPKTGSGRAASALLKRLGLTAQEAVIAESPDQVPELAGIRGQMDGLTEGLYYNGKVYVFENAIESTSRGGRPAMERAVWVATHEAVKHRGLDLLLTPTQKTTLLGQADTNDLIQSIANDIQAEAEREAARGTQGARRAPRSVYVEEALAELSGAMLTDNYEALFSRYQGAARTALKPAQGIVRRVAKAAWNTLRGKANVTFTDRDVLRLISDSYRATTTMRTGAVAEPVATPAAPQAQQRNEQAPQQSRGINIEVAPDPRNETLKQAFGALPEARRAEISTRLGGSYIRRILDAMGIGDHEIEHTVGGFAGDTNPSIIVRIGQGVDFDGMVEAAKVIGTVFSQQAVIAYDEAIRGGTGFIKVKADRQLSYDEQRSIFQAVYNGFSDAAGFTGRDGSMVFGNFTDIPNAEFHDRFDQAVADAGLDVKTSLLEFRSDWIEPVSLEGTRYEEGQGDASSAGTRGDGVRRAGGADSIQAIQSDFNSEFAKELGIPLQSRAASARQPAVRRSAPQRRERVSPFPRSAPSFNQRRTQRDAVAVQAVHFSGRAGLTSLDGKFAGTGSAGGERRRFGMGAYAADSRPGDTARRVYFYVQQGDVAPRPEDAVTGREKYAVNLTNLYDVASDPRGLRRQAGGNADFLEELVNDAGFDGAVYPPIPGIPERTAVLFGLSKRVPVVAVTSDGNMPLQSRAPTFYSATLRAIEDGRGAPKRGDATAWKGWLDGAVRRGEMRQSERDWLGLDAWLDSQESPITREALADFVRANEVKVEEVMLGEQPVPPDLDAYFEESGLPVPSTVTDWMNLSKNTERRAARAQRDGDTEMADYLFSLSESAMRHAEALDGMGGGGVVRYRGYRVPGADGETYRELLLTLSSKAKPTPTGLRIKPRGDYPGSPGGFNAFIGNRFVGWGETEDIARAAAVENATPDASTYISSHWDQPNVLAHVRFDERFDADGKLVLFINEVQSDWGQEFGAGKTEIAGPIVTKRSFAVFKDGKEVKAEDGNKRRYQTESEAQAAAKAVGGESRDMGRAESSEDWAMLAFKRMARFAVDNGFDRIAWVTGDLISDALSLKKGENDRERRGNNKFYDEILPAAVNKWGKKFGVKAGTTNLPTREKGDTGVRGREHPFMVLHEVGASGNLDDGVAVVRQATGEKRSFDTLDDAYAYIESELARDEVEVVHAIDTTPAMRDAVAQGQPLFSRAPAVDSPEFRAWFGGSAVVDANGDPMVVYHGTGADIDAFRTVEGLFDAGAHFGSKTQAAEVMAQKQRNQRRWQKEPLPERYMPVYLSIQNPKRVEDAGDQSGWDREIKKAKAEGYDGIVYDNSEEGDGDSWVAFRPDQIKSATGNVGAFGRRPVTESESAPLGMTAEAANEAQARGDIRFSRAQRPDGLSRPREITPEFVERLRNRKSFLAELLRDQGRTLEQMQADAQRVQALFEDIKNTPDFDAEIAGAEADLKRARRNALEGSRQDLAAYDAIRDLLAVLREGRRRAVSDSNLALKLAQRFVEGSQVMSPADRVSIMQTLEPMLEAAERTYVAHRKIMQWRRGREYARIKAHRKQSDALNFLAAEGFTQGSLTWQADSILEQKDLLRRRIRRTMQDKFIDLRDIQETIEEQIGAELDDAQNVYLAENLMHSRVGDAIKAFKESFSDPLLSAIKTSGFTIEQVEQYLWAKHATERNARVRDINRTNDSGSGMTDKKAAEILDGYSADQLTRLESLGARVKSIRAFTLKTLLAAGQIDKASHDRMLEVYQNYVPLRHREDGEERVGGTGQGLSSGVSGIQRALGRTKPPENILAELVGDAERAIVQSGKAEVGRALLRLVLSYPNPDIWDIQPVELEAKFSEATGEVYLGVKTPDDAETVIVKHNGKPYRVRIKHPQLAAVMRNTGWLAHATPIAVNSFGRITRWLSAVLTRYNLGFIPVNAMRDILQGMTGVWAELGAESAAAVAMGYGEAFGAAFRQARKNRGDASKPDDQKTIDDWAREAYEAGMTTGMAALDDMDTLSRDIEMTMLSFGKSMKKYPLATIGKTIVESRALQAIEVLNDAVENAIRLSTYTHLRRDKGWSQQKAATYAKEMTVNFNRRGTAGSVMNAFFLFYNAATQGSRRTIKLILEQPKVQGFVASLVAGQFALAAMFGTQKFEDDDEETLWEKIPEYVKQRSFIWYAWFDEDGTARWHSFPMPYGFNVFPAFGSRMGNYLSPNYREKTTNPTQDILGRTLASAIDAFSPVQVGDDNALAPTILRMWIEAKANRDDLGNPIGPSDDFRDRNLPDSTNYRPGTNEAFVAMANALNRIGGGTDYSKPAFSALDWSPNEIEYFFKKFSGGAGSTLIDFYKQATRDIPSGEAKLYETPVVRSIVGGIRPERQEMRRFYDEQSRVTIARQKLKDAFKRGGVAEFEAEKDRIGAAADGVELRVMKRDSTKKDEDGNPVRRAGELAVDSVSGTPELTTAPGSIADLHSEAQAVAREIGARMRSVYNDQSIGPVERERRLRELQRERQKAVAKFNRAIARARVPQD